MTERYDLDQQLLRYLRGELTPDEKENLLSELTGNETYQQRLEELMLLDDADLPLPNGAGESDDSALTPAQQKRIFRRGKWRSRLINSGFTVFALSAILILGMVANHFFSVWWFGPNEGVIWRTTQDMLEFTKPGIAVNGGGTFSSAGRTVDISLSIQEQVGGETRDLGTYDHHLFFTSISSKHNWSEGVFRQDALFFRYPLEGIADTAAIDQQNQAGWNTLEKLPEGTVAQLAISFDRLLTLAEYEALAKPYDLRTVWYAVDSGKEAPYLQRDIEQGGPNAESPVLGTGQVWGFNPLNAHRFGGGETHRADRPMTPDTMAAAYIDEMKYLTEHPRMTRHLKKELNFLDHANPDAITDRHRYLQDNGVKLYGAVLTGPTKELLKLRDQSGVIMPFVGKIDWWNWETPIRSTSRTWL